ncbi:DMT family transporter [Metabacillus rhizolycopersici]|uniref:DMT family transporter n=1 Tax=Metabacillus rhizolycopersici TaxID=2875709 RepID=A0ABS7UR78_9BACI|nr:DMT family transporter [Metabacillus rhizolycopersici]MBZ5750818.1 DMT family transporter [Metabacillus rhizolycopersici]
MKLIFPLLALIGGMALAVQSQINGGLGKKVGVIEGSFISFSVGTLALLFILLFFGNGDISAISTVPKWQLIGGLLGAFFVIVQVIAVPKIGVSATLMAVIVGQILIGAIIDHFGLFGGNRFPIDLKKMIAILLLLFALFLYYKK